jgi:hypothetical protein
MKVLIVAQARSGSTSLLKAIGYSSGLMIINEPFRNSPTTGTTLSDDYKLLKETDNIVVKIVDNWFYRMEELSDPNKLFSMFDKVIGLTRDSIEDTTKSYLVADHFNSWRKSQKSFKLSEYEYNKIISDKYEQQYNHAKNIREQIKSFDIEQFTYEGLFINQTELDAIEKYLGFEIRSEIQGNLEPNPKG